MSDLNFISAAPDRGNGHKPKNHIIMLHTTPEPARQSQVPEWLSNLEQSAMENRRLTEEIEMRFGGVIRSDQPANTKDTASVPEPHLVEVAGVIREMAKLIAATNDRMRSILARAEV